MYLLPNIYPLTVFVSAANSRDDGSNVAVVMMHAFSKVNLERGQEKRQSKSSRTDH